MKTFDELKALIEQRGVHPEFGDAGEGWGIEQNPYELATFLCRMQELGVTSCLEIGTGYKGGLSRFLAQDLGWKVTSVDVNNYHHIYEGITYLTTHPRPAYPVGFGYKFDLLFIDGAHDYENVKGDYEDYREYATKAIAFHDIAGLRDCEGVRKLWFEIAHYPADVLERDGTQSYLLKQGYKESMLGSTVGRAGIGWIEL